MSDSGNAISENLLSEGQSVLSISLPRDALQPSAWLSPATIRSDYSTTHKLVNKINNEFYTTTNITTLTITPLAFYV